MIVTEKIQLAEHHFIEFGMATWTENDPESEQVESIRDRYENQDGVFSPHGSSEIPMNDMELLINACLDRDKLDRNEVKRIMDKCAESLKRINKKVEHA